MPILPIRILTLKVKQLIQGPADSKNAAGTNLKCVVLHGKKKTQRPHLVCHLCDILEETNQEID